MTVGSQTDAASGNAPRNRSFAAIVSAVIFAVAAAAVAMLISPKPSDAVTLHSGSLNYIVSATIDPTMGCHPIDVTVTDRRSQFVDLEAVRISASMPLMGSSALPPDLDARGSVYRSDALCLSMTGPWEVVVEIRGPVATERIRFPLHVTA